MIPTSANDGTPQRALPTADRGTPQRAFPTDITRPNWQFRTSSLLWLTFTAAMTLAYARLFGPWAVVTTALIAPLAAVIGAGIGATKGRAIEGAYWATIGATLGAVCIVAAPQPQSWMILWPLLGASVGAVAGAFQPKITFFELLSAALISCFLWGLMVTPAFRAIEFTLDISLLPVVAVGFAYLVGLVDRLYATYRTSRDAWAAGLVFAVIAGNLWAAMVAGRWA